jgi:STE24 endopeptidase
LDWCLARWEAKWRVRDIADCAVVPLVLVLGSLFVFMLTPILNTYVRTAEYEADMYGLNAGREPDGFAEAAIHLAEYRKMKPGPIEEWIFFDHPSGYNRIYAAMRWKAENLQTPGVK